MFLASLLLPGLGQWLRGDRVKGVTLFGVALLMVLMVLWTGEPLWLGPLAVFWAWNVWEAARPEPAPPVWIPVITAALMFYTIGWRAAEIDLGELTGNFDRVRLIIRPMLEPDFFKPRAEVRQGWAELTVPCPPEDSGLFPTATSNTVNGVDVTLDRTCASVGDTLNVTISGLQSNVPAGLVWQSPIGDFFNLRDPVTREALTATPDDQGNLQISVIVPNAIPVGIDPNLPQEQRFYIRQERIVGGLGFDMSGCWAQMNNNNAFVSTPGPGYEFSVNGCFVLQGIYETLALAVMSTTFGTLLAIPFSFLAARNLMNANAFTRAVYVVTRTLLNIVRSIESLIIAIIFVVIVGLGPFAGMLAVTVHTVAALAKLFSELIEGIDPGPIEAMQAVGANWLQIIRYGVIPQVVPPFTAFTIYRLEINVRASTIIGVVGGGGIGFFLVQWINLSDFRAVSAAFIAILIIVALMDQVSAAVRKRLI